MLCIIQSRMNSLRYPGKVLMEVSCKPLLERVYNRVCLADNISKIVIATSNQVSDDPIDLFCRKKNIECFRGDLNNVAKRFMNIAINKKESAFIRINGDSPLIDPKLINLAVEFFSITDCDIVTNVYPRTFPKGQSIEVIKTKTFIKICKMNLSAEQKEHITKIYYDSPKKFKMVCFTSGSDFSNINMCIDTTEDKQKIESLINKLGDKNLGWKELCQFLSK